jgi:signal transduction histidine kinase
VFIAVGKACRPAESSETPEQRESHFNAIISNTPGLVYQFVRMPDGCIAFPYLSEGCQALLGISPEQLRSDPSLLMKLIVAEDRNSYAESMSASALAMKSWNWEGRIWIEEWKDIKWINLRATPCTMENGGVQWDGMMTNITQSKLEEMEIKHSRTRLAELSAHIEHVKEQERTRIAREIHDDLGGNLTAIKMALARLASRLPQGNSDLAEKSAYVDVLVDRTIEAAHRIASDLRPGILDFGIVAALEWQAKEFEAQVGIPCSFLSNVPEINLHSDQATAIFRIFQEALTNIAKHANASQVKVELLRAKNNLQLKITDNGKGIDATDRLKPQSFGIRGMIERTESLGGKLTIGSTPQGGNQVTVKIPLSSRQKSNKIRADH